MYQAPQKLKNIDTSRSEYKAIVDDDFINKENGTGRTIYGHGVLHQNVLSNFKVPENTIVIAWDYPGFLLTHGISSHIQKGEITELHENGYIRHIFLPGGFVPDFIMKNAEDDPKLAKAENTYLLPDNLINISDFIKSRENEDGWPSSNGYKVYEIALCEGMRFMSIDDFEFKSLNHINNTFDKFFPQEIEVINRNIKIVNHFINSNNPRKSRYSSYASLVINYNHLNRDIKFFIKKVIKYEFGDYQENDFNTLINKIKTINLDMKSIYENIIEIRNSNQNFLDSEEQPKNM